MKKVFGLSSIALGIFLLLNSFQGITGFSILGNIDKTSGSIVGIVLVIGGLILMMGKSQYTLRKETHGTSPGEGAHCTVYYRGERTNLNTTLDHGHVYIGHHGQGRNMDHHSIGNKKLRQIASQTSSLLEGKQTRPKGALRDPMDIT